MKNNPKQLADNDIIASQMAYNLRALMEAHGVNQKQLAEMSGLSQGTISNILTAKVRTNDFKTLSKLAGAFKVSFSEIVGTPNINAYVNIWNLLREKRWTIEQLAAQSKIDPITLRKLLSEKRADFPLSWVELIADALGVTVNDILSKAPSTAWPEIPILSVSVNSYEGSPYPHDSIQTVPGPGIDSLLYAEKLNEELFGVSNHELFLAVVKGDSMMPTIADGNKILVSLKDKPKSNDICLVLSKREKKLFIGRLFGYGDKLNEFLFIVPDGRAGGALAGMLIDQVLDKLYRVRAVFYD